MPDEKEGLEINEKIEKPPGHFHLRKGVGLDGLYLLHKDAMYRVALKALDGDQEQALGVVKKAFILIGRHGSQIADENSKRTRALMVAAVKSVLNDVYHETRLRIGIPERHEKSRETLKDTLRINQIIVRNDLVADLAKYVEKLTFAERELVFYRYFAGWSVEELARHMGVIPNEVRARIFRVKEKISKMMTSKDLI